jgi:ATP-dependent DNA helicase RecQ
MVEVCAAYIAGDMLFNVAGLKGEAGPVPTYVANTFAVLSRGAPTRPSAHLLHRLMPDETKHREEWASLSADPLWLIGNSPPNWQHTIRGNEKTDYKPALSFLEKTLPTAMPEIAFIQKLLVPEFPLFSRLTAPSGLVAGPNDEKVDFYLPQADLVIEIDGSQHCEEPQRSKDRQRDLFLERFGIVTLRLCTKDLEERNSKFERFCDKLQKLCKSSPRLQPYLIASNTFVHGSASLRYDITASIRLQVAVMMAISHRMLDPEAPEWMLHVSQDFYPSDSTQWAKVALDELLDWFALFARLNSVNFKAPIANFVENGLHIDMRLFDRPDDKALPPNAITVRTSPVQDIPFVDGSSSPRKIVRVQDLGISHLSASPDR